MSPYDVCKCSHIRLAHKDAVGPCDCACVEFRLSVSAAAIDLAIDSAASEMLAEHGDFRTDWTGWRCD